MMARAVESRLWPGAARLRTALARPFTLLRWLCLCGWLGLAALASASEVSMAGRDLAIDESGSLVLSADFSFELSERLAEAVGKGVALYFVSEFELTRPRWYWFDEKVVQKAQTWRLTYHALTRQYRLSTGVLHQNFPSLHEALGVIAHLRNWPLLEKGALRPGEQLQAGLRFYLDLSKLPKPFQIEAFANRDWLLETDWQRWPFVVPALVPAVVPTIAPADAGEGGE